MNFFIQTYNKFIKNYNKRKERLYEKGLFQYFMNSSGYILAIVLMITPLIVVVAVEFTAVASTSLGYLYKIQDRTKAMALARSGIELSKQILQMDKRGMSLSGSGDRNDDSYKDDWAMDLSVPLDLLMPEVEGLLQINISDENSKINLSVLATSYSEKTPFYAMAQRFFLNMMLPVDHADIIMDWVDIDDASYPFGAESSTYYQTLTPSYSCKNNSMDSIDEMLLLKDMTPQIFYGLGDSKEPEDTMTTHNRGDVMSLTELLASKTVGSEDDEESAGEEVELDIKKESSRRLSDYFTVWGQRDNHMHQYNQININTASYRVLSALTDSMTDDIVADIISRRMSNPFKSVNEIKDQVNDDTTFKLLSVRSHIFNMTTKVTVGRATVKLKVIYNRSNRKVLYWSED